MESNKKPNMFAESFTSALATVTEETKLTINSLDKKEEALLDKIEKETSKEKTEEIKLEIETIKKIKHGKEMELEETLKEWESSIKDEVEQDLFVLENGDKVETRQFSITNELWEAIDIAHKKLKRINPGIKKATIIEMGVRTYLGLDTQKIKDKYNLK